MMRYTFRMKRSALFVTIAPFIGITLLLLAFRNLPWTPLRISGGVLTVLGLVLLTISRVHLGNSFSIAPVAQELVTRGIYSKIRHPVYVFGTVLLTGLALYINLPYLLLLMLALVPMQIIRARAEEKVLTEKFGDAYRTYKSKTWL
jgi:protein-S-isoprenylcysteine O-methyltransferase Ste14